MDWLLSAYEFAVEVAARPLGRPKNYRNDPTEIDTRNVWPWSSLVPVMEKDIARRVRSVPSVSPHVRQAL